MRLVRSSAIALALVAAVGCGGGEEKDVKDAITQFVSAKKTGDANAVCNGLTPEAKRHFDTIARGVGGARARCPDVVDEQLGEGGGLEAATTEAIDSADVDIEGDKASLKAQDDDQRLPMEKVDGEWRFALEDVPQWGYSLRGTAACTERTLRMIDSPLPPPTRAGISRDAARDAENLAELARLLEESEPPKGKEDAQREVVEMLKANSADWERASRALRGLRGPLNAYNKALRATERRATAAEDALGELQVGCLGDARTLATAAEFRRDADRICRAAGRRIEETPEGPALLRELAAIGRDTAKKLRPLDPPESLADGYRAALDAFSTAYATLPKAARAEDLVRAAERVELLGLRSSIGFFRVGLPRCAEL